MDVLDPRLVAAVQLGRSAHVVDALLHPVAGDVVLLVRHVVEEVREGLEILTVLIGDRLAGEHPLLGHRLVDLGRRQHERAGHALAESTREGHSGEDPEDGADVGRRIELLDVLALLEVGLQVAQREAHALVRTEAIEDRRVGEVGLEHGVGMERREVVTLEVPLDGHLPVGPGHLPRRVQVQLVELETLEDRLEVTEPRVDVHLESRRQAHEDQARDLDDRQLDQTAVGLVEVTERRLPVDATQLAVHAVRPRVVGARQRPRLAVPLCADERAAVPADVQHRVDLALGVPRDDDRDPDGLERLVGVLAGELARQGERKRDPLEEGLDLRAEQLLVRVVLDRLLEVAGRLVGGLVPHVLGQTPHHVHGLLAGSPIEHRARDVLRQDLGLELLGDIGHGGTPR